MGRYGRGLVRLVLAASLAALVAGCGEQAPREAPAKKPVPVKAGRAERRSVAARIVAVGHVEAEATVAVRARVGGELLKVHFREGDDVQAGDLLFTVDPRPFEASLRQAEAALARDAALLENARTEALRAERLFRENLISRREYDQLRTEQEALQASLESRRAEVEQARLQLSYTEIRAPIGGRTGMLKIHPGNLVKPNDDVPLVMIHQMRPIAVSFAVPEGRLDEILRQRAAGEVRVEALSAGESREPETGVLSFVDHAVDRGTGTVRLKATFDNARGRLLPGQFVEVAVLLPRKGESVVVPGRAVQSGPQGEYVFVIGEGGALEMRPVTTGRTTAEDLVVVEQGLDGSERVVTDGHLRIGPGDRVEVREETPAGDDAP